LLELCSWYECEVNSGSLSPEALEKTQRIMNFETADKLIITINLLLALVTSSVS
jgi:hypothetical protein